MTERTYTNDEIAEIEGLRASIKAIDDAPVERYRAALAVLRGDPAQETREWITPIKTVGDLVNNLLTTEQDTPVHGAYFIDRDDGRRECRTRFLSLSREHVDGNRIVPDENVPYSIVIWTSFDPRDRALVKPAKTLIMENGLGYQEGPIYGKPAGCDPCSYPECGCWKSPARIVEPKTEADLEAVLNSEDTRPCTVMPDGKVIYPADVDRGTLTRNLRGLASRMEYRVEAIELRDGKGADAITGKGIGIGYLLAKDLTEALTEAASYIEALPSTPQAGMREALEPEAHARLQAMADCHIVDSTALDAYGRFEATYGDIRKALAALQSPSHSGQRGGGITPASLALALASEREKRVEGQHSDVLPIYLVGFDDATEAALAACAPSPGATETDGGR